MELGNGGSVDVKGRRENPRPRENLVCIALFEEWKVSMVVGWEKEAS
jgi:hypothetical protein